MSLRNKIVLVPFPFDELDSEKLRPVLVLTEPEGKFRHVVVAFITSRKSSSKDGSEFELELPANEETQLLRSSWLRLYRLTSLPETTIQRELGALPEKYRSDVVVLLRQLFGLS